MLKLPYNRSAVLPSKASLIKSSGIRKKSIILLFSFPSTPADTQLCICYRKCLMWGYISYRNTYSWVKNVLCESFPQGPSQHLSHSSTFNYHNKTQIVWDLSTSTLFLTQPKPLYWMVQHSVLQWIVYSPI